MGWPLQSFAGSVLAYALIKRHWGERHSRGYSMTGGSNAFLRRTMRNNASNSDACCAFL